MTLSRKLYAALAVPALTLAACGSSGGSSDSDQITKLIKDGGKSPVTLCDHMSAALLKKIGGDTGCKAASKGGKPDKSIEDIKVSVKGSSATATFTTDTGKTTAKFVKESGDWKVDG